MKCPNCHESDSNEDPHIFKNLGGKRRHAQTNTRRYECKCCGHRFVTGETYLRDIATQVSQTAGVSQAPALAGAGA